MKKTLKDIKKLISTKAILTIAFGTIMLFSCQKEQVLDSRLLNDKEQNVQNDDADNNAISKAIGAADKLCECTGFQLVIDQTGELSCPPPDKDCAKIQPCPCNEIAINNPGDNGIAISQAFNQRNFRRFRVALQNNTLPDFFKSQEWRGVFNALQNKKDIHNDLKSGNATVLEYLQVDKVYYVVVDSSLDNNAVVQESDVMMALEVPVTLL